MIARGGPFEFPDSKIFSIWFQCNRLFITNTVGFKLFKLIPQTAYVQGLSGIISNYSPIVYEIV